LVLNHTEEERTLPLESDYVSLFDGSRVQNVVKIGPHDLAILAEQKGSQL
jgi:hypothetical protein